MLLLAINGGGGGGGGGGITITVDTRDSEHPFCRRDATSLGERKQET